MRPDTLLFIYELRAPSDEARGTLDRSDLKSLVGPQLEGFHWESDFAFLFCTTRADMGPLMAAVPGLELRKEHLLRYDEWQDGANARPIVIGPLSILPWEGDGVPVECPDGFPADSACSWATAQNMLPPVWIDPGLAFGYGGHPTTRACLGFLLRIMSPQNQDPPRTFLDLGCGTGVLALAAVRLGGESALGVDYSHLAAECALRNARLNRMTERCAFEYGLAGDRAGYRAEVLMANIPLAVHYDLLDRKAYSGRRYLILSGLLPREADELKARLQEELDFRELDNHRDERWSSWLLEIRG
jgi:ribosomal protein L11 methylase PrmA